MILPAALRHRAVIEAAGTAGGGLGGDVDGAVEELARGIKALEEANVYPDGVEGLELAAYARDNQIPAMARVREAADHLERVVADDLWPLPKYSEILFVR
jgi:glutamine synthetase